MTVGHDPDGAWTVEARGHTSRGWPWFRIRKRGGQILRLTMHGEAATDEETRAAIDHAVASWPARPGRFTF